MLKLVTFTDARMTISANKCAQSAMTHGADGYSIWTPGDLPAWFKEKMKDVLAVEFGAGLYCWKALIVWEEIYKLQMGDVLVYADAGNEWIGDMRQAVWAMQNDCLFFTNGWQNGDWCKMDVATAIVRDAWMEDFLKAGQLQASTFFIRVTPRMRRLVSLWLIYTMRTNFIDNSPSVLPNVETFRETRWDQSILSALVYEESIPLHWFPTTTAAHLERQPGDNYPVLLNHHRKRNDEWQR